MGKTTDSGHTQSIERRRFIRNAATLSWSVPVIMTLGAESAGAQTPTCIRPNRPCTPGGIPCCKPQHTCRRVGGGRFKCVGPS